MLDALELPEAWLPPALESPSRSAETRAGVPVAAGAGDQAAGALGVGVTAPGPVSVVLGTSGVVFATLPGAVTDDEGRAHVFCHAVPGAWHAMGVMLSAAGALRWFRDALAPGEPYETLVAEAESWAPGVEGLLFLPYLAGERTPHADPDARGAFTGLSHRHDRGALVRAVLEGVAYGLRDSLEVLRALGCRLDVGRVSGGGARSDLWLRIVASVLGLPLERTGEEAPRTARRSSGASRAARSPTSTRRWPPASVSATRSSPIPTGSASTRTATAATALCTRLCDLWRNDDEVGDHLDGAHQPARARGRAESDQVDVVAVASRDQARAEAYARENGIERPTGATRRSSPTRTSTPSTSRSRTRCTSSGRSARSRPASTSSARSPSTGAPSRSSAPSTPRTGPAGC